MQPPTFAAGVRLPFADLPGAVRTWVAESLGGAIDDVVDQRGGFSPGAAAIVSTSAGTRGFVKAVGASINVHSLRFHRAEQEVMARLPELPVVVRPVASTSIDVDGDDWDVIVFPVIDGVTPAHPWTVGDTYRVLDAIVDLGAALTPSPWPADPVRLERIQTFFQGWSRLGRVEDDDWHRRPWVARHLDQMLLTEEVLVGRLAGDTLSHCDLRADNVMLDGERVWFVDWAHAGNTARWLDPLLLLGDVVASSADRADGGDVDVVELLETHPAFVGVDEWIAWSLLAALAATLHGLSRLPDPPGLPTIRRYQDLTAEAILRFVIRNRPEGLPTS